MHISTQAVACTSRAEVYLSDRLYGIFIPILFSFSCMALLREEFIPLDNFQHGSSNFQNTCFVAVVANLRHVLPPVMQAVRSYTWKEYINEVRRMQEGRYAYTLEHHGQHDAADLLGDILPHPAEFGIELAVTKGVECCAFEETRAEYVPMIVLVLPGEPGGQHRLEELVEAYCSPDGTLWKAFFFLETIFSMLF